MAVRPLGFTGVPPPRFDPAADVWHDICPWCGSYEDHQVGTETHLKAVVWCRTCSGSSWLHRGADWLVPRTAPKTLHDKRRDPNGNRLPKQQEPVLRPVRAVRVSRETGNARRRVR